MRLRLSCYVSVAELFDRDAPDLRLVNFLQGLETTGPRLDSVGFKSTSGTIDADGNFAAGTQAGVPPGAVQVEAVRDTARASATSDVLIEPDPLASIKV